MSAFREHSTPVLLMRQDVLDRQPEQIRKRLRILRCRWLVVALCAAVLFGLADGDVGVIVRYARYAHQHRRMR